MCVTVPGSVTPVSALQFIKALSPTAVSVSGSVTSPVSIFGAAISAVWLLLYKMPFRLL